MEMEGDGGEDGGLVLNLVADETAVSTVKRSNAARRSAKGRSVRRGARPTKRGPGNATLGLLQVNERRGIGFGSGGGKWCGVWEWRCARALRWRRRRMGGGGDGSGLGAGVCVCVVRVVSTEQTRGHGSCGTTCLQTMHRWSAAKSEDG